MERATRWSRFAAIGVLLLLAAHTASFHRYLTDDAFISFRYLDHWLAGAGLVYNPGERVWGFTHFGWIALLAPFRWLGADPVHTAQTLGLLATAASAALVFGVGASDRTRPAWGRVCALALLASNGGFLLQAWSGLETSLFSALCLASLATLRAALAREARIGLLVSGLLAAAAALVRPEGVLLFVGLGFLALHRPHGDAAFPRGRRLAALAAGFVPLLVCGVALALYYGTPWPNTIAAKTDGSPEQLRRGLHYVATYLLHYPGQAAVLLLAALRWPALDAGDRTLALLGFGFVLFAAAAGGDWMFGYRFLHPASALLCALVPGLWQSLAPDLGPGRRRAYALGVTALLALHASNSWTDFRIAVARGETYVHQGIRIGRWMREHLPAGSVLATNTAGTIPYYSQLRVIDMMGLNDRTIAGREDVPAAWKGIEKGDGRYVLGRAPDYIHFASSEGSALPMFLSGLEIFLEPEFHRNYERVAFEVDPETRLRIYRRSTSPRQVEPSGEEWARIRRRVREQMRRSRYRY